MEVFLLELRILALMFLIFCHSRYSRRGWENNFWMLVWSLASSCWDVDLRASINGLSRNLEAFERRNLTIDLRFACDEIKLSLKLLKFKKKRH